MLRSVPPNLVCIPRNGETVLAPLQRSSLSKCILSHPCCSLQKLRRRYYPPRPTPFHHPLITVITPSPLVSFLRVQRPVFCFTTKQIAPQACGLLPHFDRLLFIHESHTLQIRPSALYSLQLSSLNNFRSKLRIFPSTLLSYPSHRCAPTLQHLAPPHPLEQSV